MGIRIALPIRITVTEYQRDVPISGRNWERSAMRKQRSRLTTCFGCCLVADVSLLILMASTAPAGQSPPPPGDRNPKQTDRQREVREKSLRSAEIPPAAEKVNQQMVPAALEKLKEDFKRIQVLRNEMVHNLLAKKPLDYKLIAEQAAEINKRANRLKTYLVPPAPNEKENDRKTHVEFKSDEMKGVLVRLCNLIIGFVENPVLKNPDTTDVQQSAKAGSDLLSIIELSGAVKKSAEGLSKTLK